MRILFCAHPGIGHFFPLVQLAWAFRTRGHDVLVTIAEHQHRAAAAGLEVVDVAPDFDAVAIFEQVARDEPDFATTVATRPAIDLTEWAVQIAAVNRPMVDRIIGVADAWQPDLVVYDQGTTAGLFAAARCGVPAVQRNMSAWRTGGMHEAIESYLTDLVERYNLTVKPPAVIIESFPPSLLAGHAPEGWFMRWVPYSGGGVLGDRLPAPASGPRVAVTMGTVELHAFGIGSLRSLVDAAAEVAAEFVFVLGDIDIAPLGPLPANVVSVGWAPLHSVLRDCSAIVHHGGGGTALTAIDAGVPQLLAPDPNDQFQHTTWLSVARSGVGLVSSRDEVDAALLERLITDESIRETTAAVRQEMRALPTPSAVVDRLIEQLG